MSQQGGDPMGRVVVDFIVSNNQDMALFEGGALPPEKIRRVAIRGVVDSAANHLVLPASVVQHLGLPTPTEATVRYADRRSAVRPVAEQVSVELLGRRSVFRALVEPDRDTALIGAIVLEDLDLLVDCTNQKLYPRDPERVISEVE
jgi:predicted aspartyl protease